MQFDSVTCHVINIPCLPITIMPLLGLDNSDEDVLFLSQMVQQQQHQVQHLYHLLLMANPGWDGLEYLISELDDDSSPRRIKSPQGGQRLTEETILAMSPEECISGKFYGYFGLRRLTIIPDLMLMSSFLLQIS